MALGSAVEIQYLILNQVNSELIGAFDNNLADDKSFKNNPYEIFSIDMKFYGNLGSFIKI